MPLILPAGWRVLNSDGAFSTPKHDDSFDEGDISVEGLTAEDLRPDSPGWEDIEPDIENLTLKCFFCSDTFPTFPNLTTHMKKTHAFDFEGECKRHELDFYGIVRFINYLRSTAGGTAPADTSSRTLWEDEKFLKPVLDGDEVFTCLYDIEGLVPDR
ncbi:hypothetical protein K470DRAFT_208380 [Piedraia hortae CBS 480.64]|uniref:type I protein arginine methyltransferase n=1 Tax=Piedraia hortae CBS 480.64 TaxID=1314780 RepID=A0A6A7C9Z7_9PEZI|nr:hypothetical protein K470DRAFT_208380 [Piedraia hortae CBS 480.64]